MQPEVCDRRLLRRGHQIEQLRCDLARRLALSRRHEHPGVEGEAREQRLRVLDRPAESERLVCVLERAGEVAPREQDPPAGHSGVGLLVVAPALLGLRDELLREGIRLVEAAGQ